MLETGIETIIVSCNETMGERFIGQLLSPALIDELETMVAYFSLKDGYHLEIASVKEYLLTKLGKYKTPSFIIKVNELPKNTNGKIIKSKLQLVNENNN